MPARRLASIVKELPAAEVHVEVDSKNYATIRCGSSTFRVIGLGGEEFPPMKSLEDSRIFTFKQGALKAALRRTAYAISTDETRYVLNGIYFSFRDSKLTMVATDGRRLALADVETEFPKSQEVDVIIPTKCITELSRLLGDEGDIQMTVTEQQVSFDVNGKYLVSKLIEGIYPNYRQVIPQDVKERVELEREQFLNAVRRVSIVTSEKTNSIKLSFQKNNLEISTTSPEIGDAQENLAIQYKGREFAIAFNPIFLLDPLKNLSEEIIYMDLIDEMSPGVIKINSPFLYVLMPMRMN
jgi:DNA polymerase-3 subunit beta